jgi:hypothetical protein
MLYLLGVLIVVIGVGASIALHEIAHLVPAKKFVRVPYMAGSAQPCGRRPAVRPNMHQGDPRATSA